MKKMRLFAGTLLLGGALALLSAGSCLAAPAPPGAPTVPASDADGSYVVTWGASASSGVTYTLEEATDVAFTANLRSIAAGTALQAAVADRPVLKTYYYRVRAVQFGVPSPWATAAKGCNVGKPAAPAALTVPANDADGSFALAWSASTSAGVTTYVVEEAANATFTTALREVYRGPALAAKVGVAATPLRPLYYRVKAIRPGFVASAWKKSTACKIGQPAPPAALTVPPSDADGKFNVGWGASPTAEATTYLLQEATNAAFTANVREVYRGTALIAAISAGATPLRTLYYRVKAIRSGYAASEWQGAGSCKVGRPVAVAALAAPTHDSDGSYTLSWSASATAGVTYLVQEATAADFSAGLTTVYSGTALQTAVADRADGNYYYRVQVRKPGFVASGWKTAATLVAAPRRPLNDSGIAWFASGSAARLETEPADYAGQDAAYGRDAAARSASLVKVGAGSAGFDFTKLAADGTELPADAAVWSCVRDNATGLTWEVKDTEGGLHDYFNTFTWYNPDAAGNGGDPGVEDTDLYLFDTAVFVENVNLEGLCGANDWRLPTRDELFSLVDFSRAAPLPLIDEDYFPNTSAGSYWTASPYADAADTGMAWTVSFFDGSILSDFKSNSLDVRLVRGGE